MIQKLTISPHQITDYTCITTNSQGLLSGFPFLSIDRDSYMVDFEMQSGINFDPAGGTVSQSESAAPWLIRSPL